jgi:hypothetical protein
LTGRIAPEAVINCAPGGIGARGEKGHNLDCHSSTHDAIVIGYPRYPPARARAIREAEEVYT